PANPGCPGSAVDPDHPRGQRQDVGGGHGGRGGVRDLRRLRETLDEGRDDVWIRREPHGIPRDARLAETLNGLLARAARSATGLGARERSRSTTCTERR